MERDQLVEWLVECHLRVAERGGCAVIDLGRDTPRAVVNSLLQRVRWGVHCDVWNRSTRRQMLVGNVLEVRSWNNQGSSLPRWPPPRSQRVRVL